MSALEDARAATAAAQAKVNETKVVSAAAIKELTDARNKEWQLLVQEENAQRAVEVEKDRENYRLTVGSDDHWVGIDGDKDSLDLYVHHFTDFDGCVEMNRDGAIALRDYLNARYPD